MTAEWTNAEIMRRLEEVILVQREMLREMREDRALMAQTYVRQDVYDSRHTHLRAEVMAAVKDVADDVVDDRRKVEKSEDRWKQLAFTVGAALLLMMVTAAFAISNFMARGGLG